MSFEGGGFTGRGTRSGGVDHKGGFPAILHPNEQVIDLTKTRDGGYSAGGDVTIVNNINVESGSSNTTTSGSKAEQYKELAKMVEASTLNIINREKRPGGILTK